MEFMPEQPVQCVSNARRVEREAHVLERLARLEILGVARVARPDEGLLASEDAIRPIAVSARNGIA